MQLLKEDFAHVSIVMLAGVHDQFVNSCVTIFFVEGGDGSTDSSSLDELRPSTDDSDYLIDMHG